MPDKRLEQDFKGVSSALNHFQEENQKLKAENAELRADKEQYREEGKLEHQYRQERMNELQSEVARLRKVADFYATFQPFQFPEGYYEICIEPGVGGHNKFGTLAREALNHKPK